MRGVIKNTGISPVDTHSRPSVKIEVKRILFCRPNHRLGNLLLVTPLLQEVIETFPDCKIDLFVKGGLAPILFENYDNIHRIIQLPKRPFQHLLRYIQSWLAIKKHHYDIVINVDKSSVSGRLSVQFANAKYKVSGKVNERLQLKFKDYEHHAKYPIYNFRNYLTKSGFIQKKDKPIPFLDLKLSPLEIADGKKVLKQLVRNENQTICLFTYATGKKCYPELWWEEFYQRLKTEYPHLNIIEVLPIQNVSKLSFKAPTFYSQNIRQIGSLIANTELFIGADSGIMHLASAVQTPTVGLFSVTDQTRYAPYNINSMAINTNFNNTDKCIQIIHSILNDKSTYQTDLYGLNTK